MIRVWEALDARRRGGRAELSLSRCTPRLATIARMEPVLKSLIRSRPGEERAVRQLHDSGFLQARLAGNGYRPPSPRLFPSRPFVVRVVPQIDSAEIDAVLVTVVQRF